MRPSLGFHCSISIAYITVFQPFSCSGTFRKFLRCSRNLEYFVVFIRQNPAKAEFESDSDTEELGFPNVVLRYQSYESAPNQSKVGEPASSTDATEDEEAGLDEDNS